MKKIAHTIGGACIVRDARDIINLICGHYLRVGFGHITFIDDGSSDGTFEFLSQLSLRTSRVSVTRSADSVFRQEALMNGAIHQLKEKGCSFILPFDSDEFWNVSAATLERKFSQETEIAFFGDWVNYVQNREAKNASLLSLFRIKYRSPFRLDESHRKSIEGYAQPFIGYTTKKVGFKTTQSITIDRGQHGLIEGPDRFHPDRYEIFHIPLRYQFEIFKRGMNYEPRRAPLREDEGRSWQSLFHAKVISEEKVERVWAANSADANGFLDCYGSPVRLIPDQRLQIMLLRAWAYMDMQYGLFQ